MAKEAVGSVDLDAVVNLDDMERAAERVMDRQDRPVPSSLGPIHRLIRHSAMPSLPH